MDGVSGELVALYEDGVVGSRLGALRRRAFACAGTSSAEAMATVVATAAEARMPAPAMVIRTCDFDLRLVCLLTSDSSYLAATTGR